MRYYKPNSLQQVKNLEMQARIKTLAPEMLRFGVTGSLSTVVHFCSVLFLVSFIRFMPLSANIIAFLIAFIVSYVGHSKFTFRNTAGRSGINPALPKFFITATFSFFLNESMYYYLVKAQHLNYLIALAIVLASVSIVTFSICKLWAFKS